MGGKQLSGSSAGGTRVAGSQSGETMEVLHTKQNKENHMRWRACVDELTEDIHDRNRGT